MTRPYTKKPVDPDLKRQLSALLFRRAVRLMREEGYLSDVWQVDEEVYTAKLSHLSWQSVARRMVRELPGSMIAGKNRQGLQWTLGPRVAGVIISSGTVDRKGNVVNVDNYNRIINARTVTREAGYTGDLAWTIGGNAMRLMRHIIHPDPDTARQLVREQGVDFTADYLLSGIEYGYHKCIPGIYPQGVLYDVSGYYYDMLRRIRDDPNLSIRAIVTTGAVNFQRWRPGERERYSQIIDAVEHHKGLRNALAGAMAGSKQRKRNWYCVHATGEVKHGSLPPKRGPFRAVGLLLVRSGFELTSQEALTNACLYANIDSVVLSSGEPSVWDRLGFTIRRQAEGDTEVYSRGNYRVGVHKTLFWKQGDRTPIAHAGTPSPRVQFYRQWLGA